MCLVQGQTCLVRPRRPICFQGQACLPRQNQRNLGIELPLFINTPDGFRSPFGKKLVALPLHLSRTSRINVLWDVGPESDPEVSRAPARIVRHVMQNVRPGSIVLLHVMPPIRQPSLAAVPEIVRQLRARGYRFVTVSELLKLRG